VGQEEAGAEGGHADGEHVDVGLVGAGSAVLPGYQMPVAASGHPAGGIT